MHKKVELTLKPKGIFILEAYTLEHLQMEGVGGPSSAQQSSFMSVAKFCHELPALHPLVAIEKHRNINEGEMHQGFSAVVQFVARK